MEEVIKRIQLCPFQTITALEEENKDKEWIESYFARYLPEEAPQLHRDLLASTDVETSLEGLRILLVSYIVSYSMCF
jgi:hypothetical protein